MRAQNGMPRLPMLQNRAADSLIPFVGNAAAEPASEYKIFSVVVDVFQHLVSRESSENVGQRAHVADHDDAIQAWFCKDRS